MDSDIFTKVFLRSGLGTDRRLELYAMIIGGADAGDCDLTTPDEGVLFSLLKADVDGTVLPDGVMWDVPYEL